jgi:probable rRNA maturation factor
MADDPPPGRSNISVLTTDDQEYADVDPPRWSAVATAVVAAEEVSGPVELGLGFVSLAGIAQLHEEYLGGTGPTDVLAFPIDDEPDSVPAGQPRLLGDVVVCPEIAAAQALDHGHSLEDEIAVLVVHGVLHLLGFDHAELAEETEMFARQAELVSAHYSP